MGGRGRGRGAESGTGGESKEENKISRKLTQLLRHRIHENGLGSVLRADGYVPLDTVLGLPQFNGVDVAMIRRIVASNDKQRLGLSAQPDGSLLIRANQGHTSAGIDADALLVRLDEAAAAELAGGSGQAVHGTYLDTWPAIVASGGLHHMSRHHVHLAEGLPGDSGVISGMRRSAQVHVWVDVARAVRAGLAFYRSQNGVILSPGNSDGYVPLEFFARVEDGSGREWRNHEWRRRDGVGDGASATRQHAPSNGGGGGALTASSSAAVGGESAAAQSPAAQDGRSPTSPSKKRER